MLWTGVNASRIWLCLEFEKKKLVVGTSGSKEIQRYGLFYTIASFLIVLFDKRSDLWEMKYKNTAAVNL